MNRAKSPEKTVALKRASTRQWVLKPQDLAMLLKMIALKGRWLPYAAMGEAMYLSRFEAHAAVQRLMAAGLAGEIGGPPQPIMAAVRPFVLFGARYAYPAVRGGQTIGFPTAHATEPLLKLIVQNKDSVPVWPHPNGSTRGQALLPLYENLPLAAQEDPVFYEWLALFDALRAGQARERELAAKLIEERFK